MRLGSGLGQGIQVPALLPSWLEQDGPPGKGPGPAESLPSLCRARDLTGNWRQPASSANKEAKEVSTEMAFICGAGVIK